MLQANFLLHKDYAASAMEEGKYIKPWLLLTDFGMAQQLPTGEHLVRPKGTPLYM